jgi:AcrR family transcriptional regulator
MFVLNERRKLQSRDGVAVGASKVCSEQLPTRAIGPRLPASAIPRQADRRTTTIVPITAHDDVTHGLAQQIGALQAGGPQARLVNRDVCRRRRKDERPSEILAAALDEFAEKGFAAARLEDVARRAGIAKGTIYLYYASKHELFRSVVRRLLPCYDEIERMVLEYPGSTDAMLRGPFLDVQRHLLQSDLPRLLSVLLTEGQRIPDLLEFYYREALTPALDVARTIIQRGVERGEFRETALVELPQPLIAGVLTAVVWQSLLGKLHPVDSGRLLETHMNCWMASLFGQFRGDPNPGVAVDK